MDRLVVASVNASLPQRISADELAACLRGEEEVGPWLAHIQAFFNEVPLSAIEAFAAAHGIPMARLAAAYEVVKARTADGNAEVDAWFRYLEDPALQGADGP